MTTEFEGWQQINIRSLLWFVESALRDENGISEVAYSDMRGMFRSMENGEVLWERITKRVDATDGRFYLPESYQDSLSEIMVGD
jgi:hypothetical protein